MKKFIYISFLIVYLFAVIGAPVNIYICSEMKTVSFQKCNACENINATEHSCCAVEFVENVVSVKSNNDCCESIILITPLTDKYLVSEKSANLIAENFPVLYAILNEQTSDKNISHNYYFDSSPPPLNSNHIYLTNSTLLI